ncbi:MAG: type II 3-dehydroquinate dehydratase [Chloroflexi bacterium]|nr:type II 3-dehydroquinate dehydratase [Chloroflexota bacterium]
MHKIMVINGPNLNLLGKRQPDIYGDKTLDEINRLIKKRADELALEPVFFQSNSEGSLIDFIQANAAAASGIIINPGGLTHYSLSLRDALAGANIPVIEVHISNIYSREEWRARSVIAPVARGQISGLGWRGYLLALEALSAESAGGIQA